jgi:hypothetical protein
MAIGAAPRGPGSLACTIHIWPSAELAARSWHWPAHWHEAYERVRGLLGLAAAMCVLDGTPLGQRQLEPPISVGCLKFIVARKGDTILITITDFTGPQSDPDAPGPNGGARQPSPVGGLVLGLRGSGRCFRLVVFHGFMPPIPAINTLVSLFTNTGDLFLGDDGTPDAIETLVFDTAIETVLLASMVNLLAMNIGEKETNHIPPTEALHSGRPALRIVPDNFNCHGEIRMPEHWKYTIFKGQRRNVSRALRGHALPIRRGQGQTRPGAPPGRYLH